MPQSALRIFNSIIYGGELCPFTIITGASYYNNALAAKQPNYYNIVIGNFTLNGKKLILLNKSVISSLHPHVTELFTLPKSLTTLTDLTDVNTQVYKLLNIDVKHVISVSYSSALKRSTFYINVQKQCVDLPPHEAKYYYYNQLVQAEVARIKQIIKDQVSYFKIASAIQLYIHDFHHQIFSLSFNLLQFLRPGKSFDVYAPATRFTNRDILNLVYTSLEELLRFLENNYLQYINKNIPIPYRSALVNNNKIPEKLALIKIVLFNNDLCSSFLQIIFNPFIKLSTITLQERITYKELIYYSTYLNTVYEEIIQNGNKINYGQLVDVLFAVNFNPIELLQYQVSKIKAELEGCANDMQRLDHLFYCLKIASQRPCKLNIAFDPALPSVKHQFTSWLEEEIAYRSRLLHGTNKVTAKDLFPASNTIKLTTGFSVSQLAYFFKLMVDTGIVTHKNQRDIFRHLADNYSTTKATDISFESISNKYYNPESTSVSIVRGFLIQMLNKTKELL